MVLETIVDRDLLEGYNLFEPDSLSHLDQLMAEDVSLSRLSQDLLFVPDGVIYSLEGKEKNPTLWITRSEHNLVLQNLNNRLYSSYEQLCQTRKYQLPLEKARRAMDDVSTLRIDLTKIRLQGGPPNHFYLEIDTSSPPLLDSEGRRLAERAYGQHEVFTAAMELLHNEGIETAEIYLLDPEYVRMHAVSGPFARVAWRDGHVAVLNAYEVNLRVGIRGLKKQ
ncbi:hypothetical protein HY496_03365 [Candidatus Woesearchaeota archaeon]|nr:hypothetical protein [Candidatus Woesearchaeota archaeon]